MLQLLVLSCELPQLVLKLLDPGLRIDVVGLRQCGQCPSERAHPEQHG
jgi:hypothetical protein